MTRQHTALCLAAVTILSWSTVSTAFKFALMAMTPLQMSAVGMSVAALVLAAALGRRGFFSRPAQGCAPDPDSLRGLSLRFGRRPLGAAMLGGVVLLVYYVVLFSGYDRLPAQVAQPINYIWSIVLAIAVSVTRRQRLSRRQLCWMLVAWLGVVVIAAGGNSADLSPVQPAGLALILLSTVLFAGYWTLNDANPLPGAAGLFLGFVTASVLAWAACLVAPQPFPPLRAWLPAVYLGLFELSIPFLCWQRALHDTDRVAVLTTLPMSVPFLSLVWIHLFLGEPIMATTPLGLCLIVAGTILQMRAGRAAGAAQGR